VPLILVLVLLILLLLCLQPTAFCPLARRAANSST